MSLTVPPGKSLELRAGNQRRPVLRLTVPLSITGAPRAEADQSGGRLTFDGLLISGQPVAVLKGDLGLLELKHCTLVPGLALSQQGTPVAAGDPSCLIREGNDRLNIVVTRTICGGLRLPGNGTLTITDSVIDGTGGPAIQAGTLIVSGRARSWDL